MFYILYTIGEEAKKKKVPKGDKMHPDYLKAYERVGDKPLGVGGCASAWKVKKIGTDEIFVAKEFLGEDSDIKPIFDPEVNALKDVKHPGCVNSYEVYGEGKSGSVLILDYCSGSDLNKIVFHGNEKYPGGVIDKVTTIDLLIQMAEAVRYLHTELYMVHRDLHWKNWML